MKKLLRTLIVPFLAISCSHVPVSVKEVPSNQTPVRKTAVPFIENPSGAFSVLFLGDILLAKNAEAMIRDRGYDHPFSKITESLAGYTFCVANMETPVTGRGYVFVPGKPFIFRISPDIADTIAALDPSCLIIGNNHIMDYGKIGMNDTIEWIESKGWQHCGAGDNLPLSRAPAVLRYGNIRIVLLSYNERPPAEFQATAASAGTAPLNLEIVREDVFAYKGPGTVIVINPHWGIELTNLPTRCQRSLAHAMIDMGADAVIGQHPHCPQSVELYDGKIIFYSLGNFLTGFPNPTSDNIAAALHIDDDGGILRAEIIPVNGRYAETEYSVSPLSGNRAQNLLRHVDNLSKKFGVRMTHAQDRAIIELKKPRGAAAY